MCHVYILYMTQSSIQGQLGYFRVSAMVYNAAVTTSVQIQSILKNLQKYFRVLKTRLVIGNCISNNKD